MGCCFSAADDDEDVALSMAPVTCNFKIRRYSQKKGIGAGNFILSRYFPDGHRKWYISFYPDGYDTQPSQHVGFFVHTVYKPLSFCTTVRASFTFALLRPDGTVAYSRRSDRPRNFDRCCSSWGFREFIRRDQLESALLGVLHDDSIKARCTVTVIGKARNKQIAAVVTVPQPDFAANVMDFLKSGRAPFDVKFSVGGGVIFGAHKLVVAARSDWFAAAIYGRGEEEEETTWAEATMPCITIADTSPEAFKGVLHYMYHDTLPEDLMNAKGDDDAVMTTREIFEAADMFLIERLKKMCANRMCRFIKDDTVDDIMELAKAHSCKELERACRNHLARRGALVRRYRRL